MQKFYIGIDPGVSGAWAIATVNYYTWGLWNDRKRFCEFVQSQHPTPFLAVLEKVHAMPGQGVTSMFTFGTSFGVWQGILEALEVPYQLITPQKWQKRVLDFVPSGELKARKAGIVDFVKRIYPDSESIFKIKKNWGVADALCMARYAMKEDYEKGRTN